MSEVLTPFEVKTFGCKVNTYDTGLMQKRLQEANVGFDFTTESIESQGRKVLIINSCAVTQEATREALREARTLRKKNPESLIVMAGCSAQVDGALLDGVQDFDVVIANSHKAELPDIIARHLRGEESQKVYRSNIFRKDDLGVGGGLEKNHTRSFVKIQDGCNSFCTFCVIPYARGKSRSLSVDSIVQNIQSLEAQGVREVVLTGVHIGDYQGDQLEKLEDLIQAILSQTTMPRLRLGSLEPIELSDRIFELYKNPRLCPHFHMSIQSANTSILKSMKRNYTAQDVEGSLRKIQSVLPQAFVGMDVIVGFPGETELDFQETYDRLQSLPWTRIHVFPYSERSGTRAPLLESSVPLEERRLRAQKLRALSRERFAMSALEQVGRHQKALVLADQFGVQGLTREYWPVHLNQEVQYLSSKVGQEIDVKITGFDSASGIEGRLFAEVLNAPH